MNVVVIEEQLTHKPRRSHRQVLLTARNCSYSIALALALGFCGCGSFGSGRQIGQLQGENDRLLSEYRSQRDRIADLQSKNATLEARIAESEKLLAQVGRSSPGSRITMRDNSPTRFPGTTAFEPPSPSNPSAGSPGQNRENASLKRELDLNSKTNGSSSTPEIQWRPSRK